MNITAIIDNKGWCWTTTARDLSHALPEHQFKFVAARQYRPSPDDEFVWCRGYARSIRYHHQPEVPWCWTMTTGGKALEQRMAENGGSRFVICQCRQAFDAMTDKGYKAFLVPNGVNTVMFKPGAPKKKQRRKVGFAGNVTGSRNELKGFGLIGEACNKAGIPFVNTTSEKPLSHMKMAEWYQSLWLYAQPSESEGCSNSVMEAMACGLPVLICEGVGYHGEVCRDGIEYGDGQVVFVKRDPADISEKISLLLENPYLHQRISRNARAFAELHGWKHMARRMNDAFALVAKSWNGEEEKPLALHATNHPSPKPVSHPAPKQAVSQKRYAVIRPTMVFGQMYSIGEEVEGLVQELADKLVSAGQIRPASKVR
jgi:glycosyltransferase involved in cell wall biosynthesis